MVINGLEVTFNSYLEIAELFIQFDINNQTKTEIIHIIPKFDPEKFDLHNPESKIPELKLSRILVFEKALEEVFESRIDLNEWDKLYRVSRMQINDKTLDKLKILIKK